MIQSGRNNLPQYFHTNKNRGKFVFVLCFLYLLSVDSTAQEIKDLIQPVKMTAGKSDSILISDLYYAKDYKIKFVPNEQIEVGYNVSTQKVIFSAKNGFTGAAIAEFLYRNNIYGIPIFSNTASTNLVAHTFNFKPDNAVQKVFVMGSFNGWDRNRNPMEPTKEGGSYSATIFLEPGNYVYKFSVDGNEIIDPKNPERAPTGFETYNSVLRIPDPGAEINYLHTAGISENLKTVSLRFLYEHQNLFGKVELSNILAMVDNEKIPARDVHLNGSELVITIPKKMLRGERIVRAAVIKNGKSTNIQTVFLRDGKPVEHGDDKFEWYDASIYSIMVDRFLDGDKSNSIPVQHDSLFSQANYQGGDFQGIINKISDGYFDALGVNVIWLSPIYDNPNTAFREYPRPYRWYSGYHGYWPVNNNAVEDKFGTMTKLRELVNLAHKRKMKILLDIVAHHVHIDNPIFKQKPEWFGTLELPGGRKNLRLWDEYRLTTWFEPYMPSFDYTKGIEPIEFMTNNCLWWLKETGADGFRHDAVKHVPNEFWRYLTQALKANVEIPNQKKVYQIGETFGDYELVGSYVNNGQLSGQFNFNLSYLAIPVFVEKNKSFSVLDYHMKKTFSSYGVNHLMGNIMDSHDKIRFMAYADGDIGEQGVDTREMAWNRPPTVDNPDSYRKAEIYYAYLFTIPGIPFIYYGSEFGMTGADDPDNRRMMRFGAQLSVDEEKCLRATSELVKVRNEHSALRFGDFITLRADSSIYAYMRSDLRERLIMIINKDERNNYSISVPTILGIKEFEDIVTGEVIPVINDVINLDVSRIGWRILKQR